MIRRETDRLLSVEACTHTLAVKNGIEDFSVNFKPTFELIYFLLRKEISEMKRMVSGMVVTLLLVSMLTFVFSIQPVKAWTGTVYIRADGSIDPPDAPINTYDNVTYFLTDDITGSVDGIYVERANITIDGSSYTIRGVGVGIGINLTRPDNVTIKNINIIGFRYGIYLYCSSNNFISGNNITNNRDGILISNSGENFILGNNVADNQYGIRLEYSPYSTVFHNNFVNNLVQAYTAYSGANFLDYGYPSGGNYWSDYRGTDEKSGSGQNQPGSDGIGDTLYSIDEKNRDRYPLMAPINTFNAGVWNGIAYNVNIISNSTISNFQLSVTQKTLSFGVSGGEGQAGFVRVTVPNVIVEDLWKGDYTVLLNSEPCPFGNWTDATNTYIYLNYTHSTYQIIIIPEFPSTMILSLLMLTTLIATVVVKKKRKTKPQLP